jgi:hypothetical protein
MVIFFLHGNFLSDHIVIIIYVIISRTVFIIKFKTSPNNSAISVHYCTSLAMTIQPTRQIWLTFVRVNSPFLKRLSVTQFFTTQPSNLDLLKCKRLRSRLNLHGAHDQKTPQISINYLRKISLSEFSESNSRPYLDWPLKLMDLDCRLMIDESLEIRIPVSESFVEGSSSWIYSWCITFASIRKNIDGDSKSAVLHFQSSFVARPKFVYTSDYNPRLEYPVPIHADRGNSVFRRRWESFHSLPFLSPRLTQR